ncbi:MAG: PKD domain-containing protein [Bryobacteraceae bacterium]|nr:PKD domain-containing protein [Bryobacteraceae bacterium]
MKLAKSINTGIGLVALTLLPGSLMAQGVTRTLQFESNNTTTFGSSPFNFAGDGVANYAWYAGNSDMGRITGQGVSQSGATGKSCTMPGGATGIELKLVDHVAVTRFERTGDLLYEKGKPGDLVACLNLANGTFREQGSVEITGGTGAFKGAKGSYYAVQDGLIMVPPGSDKLQFGFATAVYSYTITLPAMNTGRAASEKKQTEASIAGPKNISASSPSVQLDGSASTSADGEALTYEWTLANEGASARILNADSATPTLEFSKRGSKSHMLQLTVTDSEGKSSTDFVLVKYAGK